MDREFDLRPTVILPDTGPLIHLAAGALLDILPALGPVFIVDVVALEATHDPDKPFAREIADWLKRASLPGANAPVRIVEAAYGDLYRLAVDQDLPRPRGAGELAIIDWLAQELAGLGGPALVVYEDARIPRLIRLEGFSETVFATTTRSLLDLAQSRGVIDDAERAWAEVVKSAPTASPAREIIRIGPNRP